MLSDSDREAQGEPGEPSVTSSIERMVVASQNVISKKIDLAVHELGGAAKATLDLSERIREHPLSWVVGGLRVGLWLGCRPAHRPRPRRAQQFQQEEPMKIEDILTRFRLGPTMQVAVSGQGQASFGRDRAQFDCQSIPGISRERSER